MSIRVHELAKELKTTSKELIAQFKKLKVSVTSHMSVLTDAQADLVRVKAAPKAQAPSKDKSSSATQASTTKVAPNTSPKATVTQGPVQTSSIENVKKEFLLQRMGAKSSPAPTETKKNISHTSSQESRKTVSQAPTSSHTQTTSAPKPKPAPSIEPKKFIKPAPTIESPKFPSQAPPITQTPSAPIAAQAQPVVEPKKNRKLEIQTPIVVKDLATKLFTRPNELMQKLIKMKIFASINQSINFEIASKVALEFGVDLIELKKEEEKTQDAKPEQVVDKKLLKTRAPIVTFMGHVDHGKTSLLDAIRKTKVAAGEAGGITQHIGAYEVFLPNGAVTFLDTPGHEAFTAMRARGARATDAVVLVAAADDGVMPQTIEAIDHAKAANVPIIVAINKMDLPSANPDRVKKSLAEHGLMAEEWGGKTVMAGVSARTGKGIDELLELLALESELLELTANPSAPASGVVIEAELSKESGVLATVLIQDGTLRVGDSVVVGPYYCRVRAMINDRGNRIQEALPSMPVEILGLSGVPKAGDRFYVTKDERTAKEIVEKEAVARKEEGHNQKHVTLEHLFEDIKSGKVEELKLIIKSDVQGSIEALRSTLAKIQSKNVRLNTIHVGTGDITESDVMLAAASNAVVIGFHVGIVGTAKEIVEREQVDVRFYEIIYEVKTAIEKAMEGLLLPELNEVSVGHAEVRQVFKVSKAGMIAGCSVQKGKIVRNFQCRVIRAGKKIHEGKIESLKRFKDDAREVLEGFECGIGVSNFNDLIVGDRIEAYEIQKKARKLE